MRRHGCNALFGTSSISAQNFNFNKNSRRQFKIRFDEQALDSMERNTLFKKEKNTSVIGQAKNAENAFIYI